MWKINRCEKLSVGHKVNAQSEEVPEWRFKLTKSIFIVNSGAHFTLKIIDLELMLASNLFQRNYPLQT